MTLARGFERDRAYRKLLDYILSDGFDAEAALSERKLAETFALGRTPVREALKRLNREGLIEVHPARGTFVRQLTRREIEEMYETRMGLEGMAAYLAAERGPTEAFAAFRENFQRMIDSPSSFDLADIHQSGQDFHVEVMRAARNDYLMEIYETIRMRHEITLRLPRIYDPDWVLESTVEHREILLAIEAGQGDRARSLLCAHLAKGMEVRNQIINTLGHSAPDAPASEDC